MFGVSGVLGIVAEVGEEAILKSFDVLGSCVWLAEPELSDVPRLLEVVRCSCNPSSSVISAPGYILPGRSFRCI